VFFDVAGYVPGRIAWSERHAPPDPSATEKMHPARGEPENETAGAGRRASSQSGRPVDPVHPVPVASRRPAVNACVAVTVPRRRQEAILVQPDFPEPAPTWAMTLEAYADTILPGEKRTPGDRVVAGVSTGGGAVAAGALDVLSTPEGGMMPALESLGELLSGHATAYADEHGLTLDPAVPPFVALSYRDRVAMVERLTAADHPEREAWVSVAMFATIAFDAAAHLHTTDALAAGHPGLTTLGYMRPDADGLWRFPTYSYGRVLASPHPDTTSSGSPR
jgi:hypothetical protein